MPSEVMSEVLNIKNKINKEFSPVAHMPKIDTYWLVGFIEGDGSFHVSGSRNPILAIGQHKNSLHVLYGISNFFNSLGVPGEKTKISIRKNDVAHLEVQGGAKFYDVLIEWVLYQVWVSRKAQDIILWCVVIHMRSKGYHLTVQGRQTIANIKNHINDNRYTSSANFKSLDYVELIEKIQELFLMDVKTDKGTRVRAHETWVLDKQTQIWTSFSSLKQTSIFFNVSKTVISNYRDSNRLFRNRYIIITNKESLVSLKHKIL